MLVCPACGLAHEFSDDELSITIPLIARESTGLAVTGEVHYLAAWRLVVDIDEPDGCVWQQVTRAVAPSLPYLYVPAFSSTRWVLQRLGCRLTEKQPVLEPFGGSKLPGRQYPEPLMLPHRLGQERGTDESGFGLFSPIVIGRQDSRVLSHFVYLILRSGDTRELGVVDYRLDVVAEELVYIPAVWDPRCIHSANWRLLLAEFDDLVA